MFSRKYYDYCDKAVKLEEQAEGSENAYTPYPMAPKPTNP